MSLDPNNPLTPRINVLEQKSDAIKNLIVNGAFEIDQRNKGTVVSTNDSFGPDRWYIPAVGSGFQQVEDGSELTEYAMEVTTSTGHNFFQKIESVFLDKDMVGKEFTFSIKIKKMSGDSHTPQIRVMTPDAKDDWSSNTILYTVDMDGGITDGSYKVFTHTFTITSYMVENGVALRPGEYIGGLSYVIRYKEAMFTEGTEVIPFKRFGRNYIQEFDTCLRYCWQWDVGQVNDYVGTYRDFGSPGGSATFPIPRPFRVFPQISFSASLRAASSGGSSFIIGMTTRDMTASQIMCACDLSAEISGERGDVETLASGYIRFDAEL